MRIFYFRKLKNLESRPRHYKIGDIYLIPWNHPKEIALCTRAGAFGIELGIQKNAPPTPFFEVIDDPLILLTIKAILKQSKRVQILIAHKKIDPVLLEFNQK